MQKIVINRCHGGFGLSEQALELYHKLSGTKHDYWEIARDCRHLVTVVETLAANADTAFSQLKVVEVPSGIDWQLHEYDGLEWIAEVHRTWS